MFSSGRTVAAIVCLASLFTCCVAPLCFECTQATEGCGDHFALQNTEAAYCDQTCVKMRGERYSDSVRIVEVSRTCIEQRDEGCYDTVWNGISVEACACNTDYCNTGHSALSSPAGRLLSLVLAGTVCLIHRLIV